MNDFERETLGQSAKVLSFCFVLASLAGLFSAMARRLRLRDALTAAGVSGVGGAVVGAICVAMWGADRWYVTCAVCGIAGWAGGSLIMDRLTFVAWSIAQGKVPTIGEPPERKDVADATPYSTFDPAKDPDVSAGGDDRRRL